MESLSAGAALRVPLNGFAMQLRPSEVASVAAGLSQSAMSGECDQDSLAEAVRQLPETDRAPAWELAVRHFGRGKALERAAGEIGMDVVHARDLRDALFRRLAAGPPSEQPLTQTL